MSVVGVRGVELGELIAEGSFGAVYRATQPSVGREVAVKVVRAGLADDPEFIRRFEAEAQIVARLEHPHIVPLYDYWREPGGAFLVMRYIRGGTAEQALRRGEADLRLVTGLVEQVGGALAAAHDVGVLHRDVKPSNILLDERGDTYLTDFGIAIDVETTAGAAASVGSPLYVAPEQVVGGAIDGRSDLYSLAVVVFELLAGQPPVVADSVEELLRVKATAAPASLAALRQDLPAQLSEVLAQATSPAPDQRQASVVDFANAFLSAAAIAAPAMTPLAGNGAPAGARSTEVRADVEIPNPYRGLLAFGEADAGGFYGRDELTSELVEAVAEHRFVTVVGASGSGKSSVVRAGLLPRLRAGAVTDSQNWFFTAITPGPRPFEQLEAGLFRVATTAPPQLLALLEGSERGLTRALLQALPEDDQLVLVLDQFEELFTLTDDETRNRFLDALVTAINEPDSQLRVVATVRADFFDGPLSHPTIGELVQHGSKLVPPMNQVELTDAITLPAQTVGVSFEPALVTRLITDVHGAPGSLPLLQYTLTELFEARAGRTIAEDAYDQLGGISGALATRAEDLYQSLGPDAQAAARRVFGRLVNLGEGTEDTRRRIDQTELAADQPTQTVLDTYGTARLLSFDRNPHTRTPTIEVAHEALIREWPRLRGWINDDRDTLRALTHLTQAAHAWDQRGRDTADLYRGARLDSAAQLRATSTSLTPLETDYITASTNEDQRERTDQRRTNRRLRALLGAAVALLAVAAVAGLVALDRASAARSEREVAEARAHSSALDRLIVTTANLSNRDRSLKLLLAIEGFRLRPDADSERSLLRAVVESPAPRFVEDLGDFDAVALARDTGHVAVIRSGVLEITQPESSVLVLRVAGDWSEPVLAVSSDATAWAVADRTTGRVETGEVSGERLVLAENAGTGIVSISISPDGRWVGIGAAPSGGETSGLLGSGKARATLWNVEDGSEERLGNLAKRGAEEVIVGDDGTVLQGSDRVWSHSTLDGRGVRIKGRFAGGSLFRSDGTPIPSELRDYGSSAAILTADGSGFVNGTAQGTISVTRVVNLEQYYGEPIYGDSEAQHRETFDPLVPTMPQTDLGAGRITFMATFGTDGLVAVGTSQGHLAVVDSIGGTVVRRPVQLTSSPISHISLRPEASGFTVVAGTELTTWDWDLRGKSAELLEELGPGSITTTEDLIIHGSTAGHLTVTDHLSNNIGSLNLGVILGAEISPRGDLLAVGTTGEPCTSFPFNRCRGAVRLIGLPSMSEAVATTVTSDGAHLPIAFSPDGQFVAVGQGGGQMLVIDIDTGATLRAGESASSERRISSLVFTTGEQILSSHDNGDLTTWHLANMELTEAKPTTGLAASAVARIDDNTILLGTASGAIHELNTDTMEVSASYLAQTSPITRIDIAAQRFAASTASEVVVWDRPTGLDLFKMSYATNGRLGLGGKILYASTPSDAPWAVPASWALDPANAIELACELATRPLTEDEWLTHLPDGEPYRETCD